MSAPHLESDLFGNLVKKISISNSKGYAAMPGTGNNDKKCRDCKHFRRIEYAKTYFKCGLTNYTGGKATDIKATAPSCKYYEAPSEVSE